MLQQLRKEVNMGRPKINKTKITNDWQKYCPELRKLRMLDIDNRVSN